MKIKSLPIYISNFKEMIESNYLYIDKTQYIYSLLKQHYQYLETISQTEIHPESLGNFDLEDIPLIPLLFQTGYLTIADEEATGKFKLGFPNREVELSFTRFLVKRQKKSTHLEHVEEIVR